MNANTRLVMKGLGAYKLSVLKVSAIAIATVVIVEVSLGLTVGSLAIVSDGLHALLDTITSIVLFATTRISLKPPDEEHMYGHEKFEAIGGLIGGIALIGVALLIMYEGILRLAVNEPYINVGFEFAGFVAIAYTFCIDFLRVGTFWKSIRTESATLKAGLYHAIADLSSTLIALIGFGLATLGFHYGDPLASMVLSILLTYLSVRLVLRSGMELSDTISKDVAEKMRKTIGETQGIRTYKNLRIRRVGSKTFVEATIQVPDYVTLEEGHALASKIERNIKQDLGDAEVVIHIEPPEAEVPTKELIEKLATEVPGVREAHEISAACEENKLYVTLHAYVDSKLTIEEAHEKAQAIEEKILKRIRDVENVAVHIEPYSARKHVGPTVDEEEIRQIVNGISQVWPGAFRIKRIVTYVAHEKRYINIDCSFAEHISIEKAHEIASKIEENVQERFAETTVTVHMEPGQA
jgi:cation diffusion facilitator family transporter